MSDYIIDWFKKALSEETIDEPDRSKLNGYSARTDVWEAVESLKLARSVAPPGQRAKVAKEAWETVIKATIADVDAILSKPRRLWHIDELASRPPQEWLIPGKILKNGITTIFGASEAGKSFLAVDYSALVSLKSPVVYIAGEGQSGYYARYKAWLQYCGHKKSGKFYLYEDPVQMLKPEEVSAFIEDIRELKPAMVVVDTLIRCFEGGDENQSKDINLFTLACDRIRREFKCAVVIIHHVTKAANTERGSGALRNNSDTMIEVVNTDESIQVICSKMKDAAHWPTEYYRRQIVEVEQNGEKVSTCVLAPWNRVKLDPEKLTRNQTSVLEVLASDAYNDCGAKTAEISTITGIARGTMWQIMNALSAKGLVQKPPRRSDPYSLTNAGRDFATRHNIGVVRL